ncbi:MAG: D-alanyl-D-alanine carboxypeptidase [Parvularculaceae bacterium]|nr:D-alanyl-D-alanine carboxypeptidase [Parvularculaceae bacterium]
MRSVFLAALAFTLSIGATSDAQAKRRSSEPKYAALVIHADSGDVLFERYADARRYPASLTKMMTLYMLFEEIEAGRLNLNSELSVSAHAAGQPPSKLGLTAGSKIDVETAIKALVVKSANDVAAVVAEGISGSEWQFAQKMTTRARQLGMRSTTFKNASGLPNSRQTTTARDLAVLGQRLMQDFPQYFVYFNTTEFAWNGRTYLTHNALVKTYEGANGIKTGYTRRSGFNLVTSADRNGSRLIGVVLGGRSVRTRDAHMKEILTEAFAAIAKKPSLIAALHREPPTPRLKPTLIAALEQRKDVPTIAGNDALQSELKVAAASFGPVGASNVPAADDRLGALIAAARSDDFNEFERVKLSALTPSDNMLGEGDFDELAGWSVQIGAYSSKSLAQKELEAAAIAAGLTGRARAVTPAAQNSGAPIFRARFTMLSETEASATCEKIRAAKLNCFSIREPAAQ